jgi:SLOG cluster2
MTYREPLGRRVVAISASESADLAALGLSEEHLRDAMTEIAMHLLALGARLVYGGDLRAHGFSELLFELVARHRRDADEGDERTGVVNYLAWPVHIRMKARDLERMHADLAGSAEIVCLALDGSRLPLAERMELAPQEPKKAEWAKGLTAMRRVMRDQTDARIVLGGRVDQYKGVTPGIAEEALLSLRARQPLFVMGGFGGCARDVAEIIGVLAPRTGARPAWRGGLAFRTFSASDLNNHLAVEENVTLAHTPHVDQAITLILRGLLHLGEASAADP